MATSNRIRNISRVHSHSEWTTDDETDDPTPEGQQRSAHNDPFHNIGTKKGKKHRYKFLPNRDVLLSRKYERLRTIENDNIVSRENKLEALILLLKLPHIYTKPEHEQYRIVQDRYSWIDDEDGDIDQFQFEEIQEMVAHMIFIERQHIYDTIPEYDEVLCMYLF